MKTLEKRIRTTVQQGNKAFVPYMMAGDGGLTVLNDRLLFLQEAGVTAIEIGIPFSDPVADGETIQQAGERALANGVTLRKVLDTLETRSHDVHVPLVIMTYLNPILAYGIREFIARCSEVGIKGLIIPDLPLEENVPFVNELNETDIALIPLVSLTSSADRIANIVSQAEGFVYAVTVNGITGIRNAYDETLVQHLQQLKASSPVPVLAGFGISTARQIEAFGACTDGVIVGSAIVEAFHRGDEQFIKELVQSSTSIHSLS
ncbi:tryptophan synthase subunit alpha [Sporosarcina sp. ITBMC105]